MYAAPMRHTETRSGSDSSSSSGSGAEATRRGSLELGRAIGAICVGMRDDGDTDSDRSGHCKLVGGWGKVLQPGTPTLYKADGAFCLPATTEHENDGCVERQ